MQLSCPCVSLLMTMMTAYLSGNFALASPAIYTTQLVNLPSSPNSSPPDYSMYDNTEGISGPVSSTASMVPLSPREKESCGENRGMLKAFICSTINNTTMIYSNTSDFNAILKTLACKTEPETKEHETGDDQWFTSAAIWVRESVEMFILLEVSLKAKPEAKREILATAAAVGILTMTGIYTAGIALDQYDQEIPKAWSGLITGLTELKTSISVAGWALALAGGMAGSKEAALSGLLINVAVNTFRETGEGALGTLPLLIEKQYAAIALSTIPVGVVISKSINYSLNTRNPCLQFFAWAAIASLGAELFAQAWHNFEQIAGASDTAWNLGKNVTVGDGYEILSHERLPMAFIAPFGYRASPTYITVIAGMGYFAFIALSSLYRFIHKEQEISFELHTLF